MATSLGADEASRNVDRRFAYLLGVDAERLREPGIHFVPDTSPESRAFMGFAVFFLSVQPLAAAPTTVISAAADVCERAEQRIEAIPAADTERLNQALLDVAASLNCDDHYLCNVLVGDAPTLTLAPPDPTVVELRDEQLDLPDWNATIPSHDVDGPIYAVLDDVGGLMAWAGVKRVSSHAQDIQVATRPDARRRGLGYHVASAAIRRILDDGVTPYYAHVVDNVASAALASALGFRPYGQVIFAESRLGAGE